MSYPQNRTKSLESEGQKNSPQVLYNPGNDNHTVRCLFWGKFDSEKKNGGKLIISYVMFEPIVGMQRFSSRTSAAHKKWKKYCLQRLLQFRQLLDCKRHMTDCPSLMLPKLLDVVLITITLRIPEPTVYRL